MIGKREGEEGPLQGGKIDEDEVEGGDDSKDHRDNRLKKGQGGVAEKREEHTAWNGKAKRKGRQREERTCQILNFIPIQYNLHNCLKAPHDSDDSH